MKLIIEVLALVLVQTVSCQQQNGDRLNTQAQLSHQKDEEIKHHHPHRRCGGPSHIRCPHRYRCKKNSQHFHAWGHCVPKHCFILNLITTMIFITLTVLINLTSCQISTLKKSPSILQFCESGFFCNDKSLTCKDGFTCKQGPSSINIGCCTKLPPHEEEPELALCGGFTNQQCAEGFECKYGKTGSIGHCEPLPKCGGFANKQCEEGFVCKLDGNGSDLGTCVRATCGGFAGAKCPSGYGCVYLAHADYGYCYINKK
ncbi:hypothetical protein CONCODRAFT_4008 [Conidiobolus coronatus NRRL 28638]|uniref:Uncharacterized protein n=1 Tax=Conidiobolus coronatus (strain ATCC 28846 / CBS 209.66 / NRRL 28638) TaxID=796925 RepID=A0A137PDQ6_CONC2|nr:hypothetical protein CONCODRAFT_4008 [Conidiobolus coronatus NRRL 28638]|eukprot:KXN73120.1 hypothetical protein CONCODRAFT_4008 [Conidiobolus coronatus NRRL 28638]